MIRRDLLLPLVSFIAGSNTLLSNISFPAISNLIETSLNVGLNMHVSYRLTFKFMAASLFVHSACITKKHCPSLGFCRR